MEDSFLQSLLEKNVYFLFMHGSTIYDGLKKTYKRFTIPDDQTIVSFTSPGEVLLLNMQLSTYFSYNSNSRHQTLLPLLAVNDSSDLYGKAEELHWYMNNIHMVPAPSPLRWDVTETPRQILAGYTSVPFRGGESQIETLYRSDGGATYPDMEFKRSSPEEKYLGLFHYTPKGVQRVTIPDSVKLSTISDILEPNAVLFILSCTAWSTEYHYPELGRLRFNPQADDLDDDMRAALRAAETLVRENELEYKASHPLLSSKSAKGWPTFRRAFGRVRIPVLSFYIHNETPFIIPEFALASLDDDEELFKTATGTLNAVSMKDFRNANVGLVTRTRRRARRTRRNHNRL